MSSPNTFSELAFSQDQITRLTNAFSDINEVISSLNQITSGEKSAGFFKMNKKYELFLRETILAIEANGDFVPPYFSPEQINKEYTFYLQLKEFSRVAISISEKLDSTSILVGDEVYQTAITVYGLFKAGANAGLKDINKVHDKLSSKLALSLVGTE